MGLFSQGDSHMLARIVIFIIALSLQPVVAAANFRIEQLSPVDQTYMQEQRDYIDQTARLQLGSQLNGTTEHDLRLLQRLLDRQLIGRDNTQGLQAMGVVLGDCLKREEGLSWVVYIDQHGRSRALAIPGQDEVVFPVTMISRRAEAGSKVDVNAVYDKARAAVAEIRKIIIVR
jgi:hypothetical protein